MLKNKRCYDALLWSVSCLKYLEYFLSTVLELRRARCQRFPVEEAAGTSKRRWLAGLVYIETEISSNFSGRVSRSRKPVRPEGRKRLRARNYREGEKCMRFRGSIRLLAFLATIALLLPGRLLAQSTVNGAISGTATDSSGAVMPNLIVALKSLEKGFTQEAKTNSQGFYQFPLLEPGTYSITISAPGFKTLSSTATVSVGQNAIVNAKLEIGAPGITVEVSGEAPLLQTESSEISTTFNAREISEVPNPGNDLSFVAQTAAGSVMNTGSGYGNFSSFGVSATSNLFTLNGMYDNDPFLNLNNSGATNLLLGNNEVQEATVVTNGYSGQYGGFAGANVNYITKSGSNNWHGNANYWWDGRVMNATSMPRPLVVRSRGTRRSSSGTMKACAC